MDVELMYQRYVETCEREDRESISFDEYISNIMDMEV